MSHGLNCEVGVINFIHEVEDSQRWEGNENEDNCWEDGSDDFDFLGV